MATDEKNQILVIKSVINYVKYKGQSSIEEVSSSDDAVFEVEKAKNERAKRKIAELKLAKMNGEVYSADTVEQVMTEMLVNLRTQLLGLPTKLAPQLQNITKEEAELFIKASHFYIEKDFVPLRPPKFCKYV